MTSCRRRPRGRAVWFGAVTRPLFGWYSVPDDGMVRGTVVVCSPIGTEADNAQVAFDALEERLTASGVAMLRFDYDGTGDSAGNWSDPGRLESWLESARQALRFARDTSTGCVALLGMRMGALIAAEVAGQEGGPHPLVLWDPCHSGRRFLREQTVLLAAAYGVDQPDDGSVEGPALVYSGSTVADLRAFDPLGRAEPVASRVLLLTRPERPPRDVMATMVAERRAEWRTASGLPELLDIPGHNVVPESDVGFVASWLAATFADGAERVDVDGWSAEAVVTEPSGVPVRERVVDLGDVPLFGILSTPLAGEGPLDYVFLSAGALSRSGPARMWTELARRWSAAGLRCLRVDLSGLGYSGVRVGQSRQVVLAPEALDDLHVIASGLGKPDGRDIVFIGLSAGGYLAVESGIQLRPRGIFTVNPSLSAVPPECASGWVSPRRRASRPMPAWVRAIGVEHKRISESIFRSICQVAVRRSPLGPIVTTAARGTVVKVLVCEEEAKRISGNIYWSIRAWGSARRGRFQVHVVRGRDHSLYTRDSRVPAMDTLTDWALDLSLRRNP